LVFGSSRIAIKAVLLIGVAGSVAACDRFNMSEVNFFPNRGQMFKTQDWGSSGTRVMAPDALPSGPVSPEDEVDAAGRCNAPATAQTEVAVGTVAGDLGTTTPAAPAAPGVVPGGISLGMTECQVVARAGQPGQVNVGVDEGGSRKVVLTYQSGPWPGVYTFAAGRLKVVDRVAVPEQAKPAKKKARGAKTANTQR
jgi:hypothetical protein